MKRGGPLRRGAPLRRRRRLKPMSDKRRDEKPRRDAVREETERRAGGRCQAADLVPEVTCWGPLDTDEIVLRSGRPGGHLDTANTQALCRGHHQWKDANPREAARRGLRRWSWQDEPRNAAPGSGTVGPPKEVRP